MENKTTRNHGTNTPTCHVKPQKCDSLTGRCTTKVEDTPTHIQPEVCGAFSAFYFEHISQVFKFNFSCRRGKCPAETTTWAGKAILCGQRSSEWWQFRERRTTSLLWDQLWVPLSLNGEIAWVTCAFNGLLWQAKQPSMCHKNRCIMEAKLQNVSAFAIWSEWLSPAAWHSVQLLESRWCLPWSPTYNFDRHSQITRTPKEKWKNTHHLSTDTQQNYPQYSLHPYFWCWNFGHERCAWYMGDYGTFCSGVKSFLDGAITMGFLHWVRVREFHDRGKWQCDPSTTLRVESYEYTRSCEITGRFMSCHFDEYLAFSHC